MVLTKLYLKNNAILWGGVITMVTAIVVALAAQAGRNMIDYYCASGSLFLGVSLSGNVYCGIIVALVHVVIASMIVMALLFTGALLLDGVKLGSINLYRRIIYIFRNRNAKITVAVVSAGDEHFVNIKNSEFLLRADDVVVNSHFIFYDKKFDGHIKWSENNLKRSETSINSRKHKLLHAVTTTNDGFIIHMSEGDEVFPYPGKEEPYYVFPLYISGSMSFLGYTVERVKLVTYEEVMIMPDRKAEIRRPK